MPHLTDALNMDWNLYASASLEWLEAFFYLSITELIDERILLQIGTNNSNGRGIKRSTLEVRRSKVKVTVGLS